CPGGRGELIVHTPGATVVDIGTEFGVAVSDEGQTEVHVFEGSVDLSARSSQEAMRSPRRLTAGHARQVDRRGTRIDTIDHRELAFVRDTEFDANIKAAQGSAYHRWLALQYKLRRDPSLVAYYIMDPAYTAGNAIVNLAPTGSATDAIV